MNRTITHHAELYINYLRRSGYKHRAISDARRQLDYFDCWAASIGVTTIGQLTTFTGTLFHDHLEHEVDLMNHRAVGPRIKRERLTKLRRFASWLHRKGHLPIDLSPSVPIIDKRGNINQKHAPTTTNLAG
jgi:hypothetical protein